MQNSAVKRQVQSKGMSAADVVLIAVLLAAGSVLRLICPPIFGITPNFVIGMYCLAVILVKPKFFEAVGISIVAAAVCHFTTKSMVPYINFLSEPAGLLVAYVLVKLPFSISIRNYSFKPAVVTFAGTVASGLTYITLMKFLVLFVSTQSSPAYTYLLLVVIVTAVTNTIIAQLLYYPVKLAAGKNN